MRTKLFLFSLVMALFVYVAEAQIAVKDSKFLNLGLGIGTNLYSGAYYSMQVPPLNASFEVVIKDQLFDENSSLGVGGYLGYTAYKWSSHNVGWKYSSLVIGPRGYLHYFFVDNLDTYTGLLLGYNILTSKWTGTGTTHGTASAGGVAWSWFIGGRYFFTDNIAAMAEFGYGVTYLNIGVSFAL